MSYRITDEEMDKVKQVIDEKWEELCLEESDQDTALDESYISAADPIEASYEDAALLVPDTEEHQEELKTTLSEYSEN